MAAGLGLPAIWTTAPAILIGIGILGEYLGRSYFESKRRPVFLVRHVYEAKDPR